MEVWKSENNPGMQTAMAVGITLAGAVLAIGFRHFHWPGLTNETAGFLLGILLLVIGVAAFLLSGGQTVVVDPARRLITIDDTTRVGARQRVIAFRDIADVSIGYIGKKSNFVEFYYLSLTLRNGERYPLFGPARYYPGSSDRAVVEGWKRRLEGYLVQGTPGNS